MGGAPRGRLGLVVVFMARIINVQIMLDKPILKRRMAVRTTDMSAA